MKNKEKPIYETPKVMRLDDSDSVFGGDAPEGACSLTGSNALNGCDTGNFAVGTCSTVGNDPSETIS
jgi:hypothetical protein